MKNIPLVLLFLLCALSAITCKSRTFSNPVDPSVAIEAPAALEITGLSENAAALRWKSVEPDPEYRSLPMRILIEQSADSVHYVLVDSVSAEATTRTITGVYQAGVTYSFRIRVKADGNISTFSNTASKPLTFGPPSGLSVTTLTETSATLAWSDNSTYETKFLIERSSDGTNYAVVDSAVANATTKAVAGIYLSGITYSFRVRAASLYQTSAYSNSAAANCVLAAPSGLVVNAVTDTTANLQWSDNSTFETGFLIEQSSDGTLFSPVDSVGPNITSKTLRASFLRNVTYSYRVLAKSVYQRSAASNVAVGAIPVGDPTMVFVTGGAFQMGSAIGYANEQPVHAVTVGSFAIDKYEITYEKWTEVRTWALAHGYMDLPAGQNGYNPSGSNNPVTAVNWYDVVKWCNARSEKDGLTPVYYTNDAQSVVYRTGDVDCTVDAVKWTAGGYRLPTEAEWEFAARGGTKTNNYFYSGSNTLQDVAWYYTNAGNTTHQAGTKSANELGLYDMSGNVWERCWDWYGLYSGTSQTDPTGAVAGSYRVVRGGTFNNLVEVGYDCRVAYRDNGGAGLRPSNVGFRCVHD
jgi:formylglycine-generating enzyme